MKKAKRRTTPTLSRRQWFEDGVAPETETPMSPSKWPTIVRHTSADRQRQYAAGGQPLAVIDELIACLRDQRTTATHPTVPVPRWAIDAAVREIVLRITLDRRRGRNASLAGKAVMESTHRLRYEMVQKVEEMQKKHLQEMVQKAEEMDATHRLRYEKVQRLEQRRFTGRLKWELAAALCGEEPAASAKAVQQSYALIKKNPSLGLLSAKYVAASSPPLTRPEVVALPKKLEAIVKKYSRRSRQS